MKNIITITYIALLLLGFTRCQSDFLNVKPTQFLTEQQVAEAAKNNPDVIAGSMSGIYTLMFQTGTGGTEGDDDFGQKGYDIFDDFLSSDVALTQDTYGWYRSLTEYTVTTDYINNGCYIPWRYYYRLIRSANSIIAALGGNDAVPDLDANKHIMGQAKAMRAYCYFYLSQLYATDYNPTTEILPVYTDPNQQNQPKSTTQAVYALIVKDLTESIPLLETFKRTGKHQVNKYVAEGMLAYAYAVMGGDNLAKAQTLTADIIANGGFTILPADEVVFTGNPAKGGFNNVNSPSWMWGVDITLDNGLNLVSWWGQMDVFTYSYQWAGDNKAIDKALYDLIPANDVRKNQFYTTANFKLLMPGIVSGKDTVYNSEYNLMPAGKFYDPGRKIGGQRDITTDYVYMRIEEIYLLNAEIAAKVGDEATARTSLKAVLNKRLPVTSYIDGLSGQALKDEIYLQTRIELWGEGKSYLAMKRNHATIIRGSNHLSFVGVPIPYNDPRLTFSIPQSEIQNNPFID